MLRARSQATTPSNVALTSGNFGLVRIPILLLFMDPVCENGQKGGRLYRVASFYVNARPIAFKGLSCGKKKQRPMSVIVSRRLLSAQP